MEALQQFFMEEFRELYRHEKRWMIILPEVARNMSSLAVERAVMRHLEQTAARVVHLEELFELITITDRQESQAMRRLLKEADEVLTAVALSSSALRQQTREEKRENWSVGGAKRWGEGPGPRFSRN